MVSSNSIPTDFYEIILNSITSSTAANLPEGLSVKEYIESPDHQHSLVCCSSGIDCSSDHRLPWTISATSIASDGSRIWFIAFSSNQSFVAAFRDPSGVPISSPISPAGHVLASVGVDEAQFDPAVIIHLLKANEPHKVVFCGCSLGGSVATVQFLRILKLMDSGGSDLVRSGRCSISTLLHDVNMNINVNILSSAYMMDRLRCITFGAPLIGDKRLAGDLHALAPRVTAAQPTSSIAQQGIVNFVHEVTTSLVVKFCQ